MTCTRDHGAIVADCDIHVFACSWLVQLAWERGGGRRNGPGSSSKCQCYLLVDGRSCSHLRFLVCPRVTLQTPQRNFVHQHPVLRQIASRSRTRCRDPPAVAWSFTRNIILHRHIETSPDQPSYSASNGARDGDNTAALHLLLILFSNKWPLVLALVGSVQGDGKVSCLLVSASADVYGLRRVLGDNLCHFDANNSHVVRMFSVSVDGSSITLIWQNAAVSPTCVSLHLFTYSCGLPTMYVYLYHHSRVSTLYGVSRIRSFSFMLSNALSRLLDIPSRLEPCRNVLIQQSLSRRVGHWETLLGP